MNTHESRQDTVADQQDTIERLRQENLRLRKALVVYANCRHGCEDCNCVKTSRAARTFSTLENSDAVECYCNYVG